MIVLHPPLFYYFLSFVQVLKPETLRNWLKTAGAPSPGQADRQNREAHCVRDLEAEVRDLRKKLAEKDEVIDVLKKSVGIISKP